MSVVPKFRRHVNQTCSINVTYRRVQALMGRIHTLRCWCLDLGYANYLTGLRTELVNRASLRIGNLNWALSTNSQMSTVAKITDLVQINQPSRNLRYR